MPSRIEVELTSTRPDGTWTWRAAGARQPKGVVAGSILPAVSKVGDVLRVEAEFGIDGIEIVSVVPTRTERKEPERLELLTPAADASGVTTSLVRRERGDRRREPGGRDRDDRRRHDGENRESDDRRGRRGPQGDRPPRREGEPGRAERPRRERRDRPSFTPPPELPQRPKPKRLRPGRTHRNRLIASLPEEQRPIAEQLLVGGLPAVRQALREQNDTLRADGKPEIKPAGIESLAQDLLPKVRVAEWLDRADAATAVIDELDLRDLRSVVTAAADPVVARNEATRDQATALRAALERRQDEEQGHWLEDMGAALDVGRVIRALKLSSRPPKAGVPFPTGLSGRLSAAALGALSPDAPPERWAAVIEALAFSPVHAVVVPSAPPERITDELRAAVRPVAGAVPEIATLLGVEVPPPGTPPRSPRPPRRPPAAKKGSGKAPPPAPRAEPGKRDSGPDTPLVEEQPSSAVAERETAVAEPGAPVTEPAGSSETPA